MHVRKLKEPVFTRRADKVEGNVELDPEGALTFAAEASAASKDPHLYVAKVNGYIKEPTAVESPTKSYR